ARTVTVVPAIEREIVALTLPDLARVPAVAATLDHLALASSGPAALSGPAEVSSPSGV
ncbi:LysR family transcriptional regulator, partial [Streptomyces sp. DT225]